MTLSNQMSWQQITFFQFQQKQKELVNLQMDNG